MYQFHVSIHARPDSLCGGQSQVLCGRTVQALVASPEALGGPLRVTFEEAGAALAALPRMFFEPDGSFVWVSPRGKEPTWQVEGCLYDRAGRLLYVELWGRCPAEELDRLLAAFGWPGTSLAFQLVREAALLDEPEFRAWSKNRPN